MTKKFYLSPEYSMVLEKSRPTYHYRFTVIIIKDVIFCQIKIMVLEKSRPGP